MNTFHVDMCPDCGAVPFQHWMDPPWFCDHPRDRYVPVECVVMDDDLADPLREVLEGSAREEPRERKTI